MQNPNCDFVTAGNHNVNIWYEGHLICGSLKGSIDLKGVVTRRLRTCCFRSCCSSPVCPFTFLVVIFLYRIVRGSVIMIINALSNIAILQWCSLYLMGIYRISYKFCTTPCGTKGLTTKWLMCSFMKPKSQGAASYLTFSTNAWLAIPSHHSPVNRIIRFKEFMLLVEMQGHAPLQPSLAIWDNTAPRHSSGELGSFMQVGLSS